MERKTSDVLIDLEEKVSQILSYVRTLDTNLKLLLNEKNTQQPPQNIQEALKQAVESRPSEAFQPSADKPQVTAEPVDFPQVEPVKPGGKERVVQEKIFYKKDNKVVLLAQVEIFDSSGKKLVKKTRTNNQGAWTAKLSPGSYHLRVAKSATSTKPAICVNYQINVTPGDGPLTLESRKL